MENSQRIYKDSIGQELMVGDKVVFMQVRYRNLLIGEIRKMSDKMLTISHDKTNEGGDQTRQAYSQVIRYNEDNIDWKSIALSLVISLDSAKRGFHCALNYSDNDEADKIIKSHITEVVFAIQEYERATL